MNAPKSQHQRTDGAFAAISLILLAGCTPNEQSSDQPPLELGINLEGLSYWGTEVAFLNLAKMSAPWLTQCEPRRDPFCADGLFVASGANSWNTQEQDKLDLDDRGYPRRLPDPGRAIATRTNFTTVATLVPTGLNPLRPAGRFIVRYEGEGRLNYGRGAVRNEALSAPGRDVIDVNTDGLQTWFQITLAATDPRGNGRYLQNIRVVPDGGVCSTDQTQECNPGNASAACPGGGSCRSFDDSEASQVFHPRFLRNLQPFKTIRFMAFQNTNASWVENWSQRNTVERFNWVSDHGDGVPLEMIVTLANRLGTDLWLNVPTRATDEYVHQYASFVRDHLDASRRIYLEYSNEAWNTAFPGGSWIESRALQRWPGGRDTSFGKRLQWYGMRTAQVCDIWRQEFGAQGARLQCVMGAQAANPWTARQAMDCPLWVTETNGTPCHQHGIAALAVAPYFGFYVGHPKHLPALQSWTRQPGGGLDSLYAELYDGGEFDDSPPRGALAQAAEHMRLSRAAARQYGLPLIAYEGGQHLVAMGTSLNDKSVVELFIAANRDARMAEAYGLHLDDWRTAGGGLYNLWNSVSAYTIWGSWGLKEYRDQVSSPKYDAVIKAITPPASQSGPNETNGGRAPNSP